MSPDRLSTNVQQQWFSCLRLYIVTVSLKPKLSTENTTTERINLFHFSLCKEGLVAQYAARNGRNNG